MSPCGAPGPHTHPDCAPTRPLGDYEHVLIAASVIAEVVGTVALKHSDGFTRLFPSAAAATCYALAIWLMAVAMRQLDMGITYAVWAASGTAATALVGAMFYGENLGGIRMLGLVCVLGGVVMLNLGSQR